MVDKSHNRNDWSIFNRPGFSANHLTIGWLALIGMALVGQVSNETWAQPPLQIHIQQPVIRHFSVNTVVSVPDGGTMNLGSIHRSAEGTLQMGVPGLRNVPYGGRLFQNRSLGISRRAGHASVSVHIISLKELEQQIMKEAERRQTQQQSIDLNGSPAVQQKSDFISRNLGRR